MSKKKSKLATPILSKPADVAETYLDALETGKQGYKTADAALDLLIAECRDEDCPKCGGVRFKNGGIVKLPDGSKVKITDVFAGGKTRSNVGQNVRRFQLEPTA